MESLEHSVLDSLRRLLVSWRLEKFDQDEFSLFSYERKEEPGKYPTSEIRNITSEIYWSLRPFRENVNTNRDIDQ